MKVAKHVLILLGLVGVLGAVMPFAQVRKGVAAWTLSAKDLSFGLGKTHAALDTKLPKIVAKKLGSDLTDTRDDLKMVADYLKWSVLVFIPSLLLFLLGVIAVARKRLGRGLAGVTLFVGLIALASWIGLHFAIEYALEEADVKGLTIDLLPGAHMLILTALTGIGIGIAALVKPEPVPGVASVRQPPRSSVPPQSSPPPSSFPPPSMPPPSTPPPAGPAAS